MNNNYALTFSSINKTSHNYFIVFTLKNKQYAINIQNILEVINIPEIEIPAKTPESIIGILNYNGMMIKAVDLCPHLGFEPSKFSINNKLIIAIVNDCCFAIHTEKIENIVQLNSENIQPIPYEIQNSILTAVYKDNDNSINIININELNRIISELHTNNSLISYSELLPDDEKSQQIMKIRTQQNQLTQEIFSFLFNINTLNQYILFELNNHNYYLDLKCVKEFISIKRLKMTKLPYTQEYIKGIVSVRGDFLVVIDLKKFLNEENNNQKEGNKLIVVEGKDFNIAFLVDNIKYIKNLKNNLNTGYNTSSSKYISYEFVEDDELYSILNFDKIINDEKLYINID